MIKFALEVPKWRALLSFFQCISRSSILPFTDSLATVTTPRRLDADQKAFTRHECREETDTHVRLILESKLTSQRARQREYGGRILFLMGRVRCALIFSFSLSYRHPMMSHFHPQRLLADLFSFVHPAVATDVDDEPEDELTADFDADSDGDALLVNSHSMMQSLAGTQNESNFMSSVGPLVRLADTIISTRPNFYPFRWM